VTVKGLSAVADWPMYALDLSNTGITDKELEVVSKITALHSLKIDEVDTISLEGIAALSRLPYLTSLKLRRCKLKSDITPALLKLNKLNTLDLSRNNWLTSKHLRTISKMSNLRQLVLSDCRNLTAADLAWIKKRMPGCIIFTETGRRAKIFDTLRLEHQLSPLE
jgi:hypothetical protein